MSRIFRRTHDDAQASSSTKNRKRSSTDDSVQGVQPLSTGNEGKKASLLPNPKDLLHRSKPAGSPASQHTIRRFEDQTDFQAYEAQAAQAGRTPRSDRRGSTSSRPSVFRAFDDPPSPRSESASLPGDKGRGRDSEDQNDASGDSDSIRSAVRAQGLQPLTKQVEDEGPTPTGPPPDATSSTYPGVVLGAFGPQESNPLGFDVNAIGLDGSINDILDPSAAPVDHDRQGSSSVPPAPNIAPWLADDAPPTPTPPRTPVSEGIPDMSPARELPRKQSISALNHFGSVSSLPKVRRNHTQESFGDGTRQDSNSYFPPPTGPTSLSDANSSKVPSRVASTESVQTLSARRLPPDEGSVHYHPGGGRHPSASGTRMKHGSIASTSSSAVGDRKKGFLGGLLKRRTGQSLSHTAASDFGPSDGSHRGSASTTSRLSTSTSQSSHGHQKSLRDSAHSPMHIDMPKNDGHLAPESAVSPMYELREPEFTLDMNLDDMEGIVDPTIANAPPSSAQTTTSTRLPSMQSSHSGRPATSSTSGSVYLDDPPAHNSSFSTTTSDSSSSALTAASPSVSSDRQTSDPFTRPNPFQSSPRPSLSAKSRTPPSPNTLTLSPKYSTQSGNFPRRPSHLRNVKIGSFDSEASSSDTPDSAVPAWASGPSTGLTLFSDPFVSQDRTVPELEKSISPSRPDFPSPPGKLSFVSEDRSLPSAAPAVASAVGGAAWAAPESWGVEAEAEQDTTSSSEEDEWVAEEGGQVQALASPTDTTEILSSSPSASTRKPPPFGYKSANKSAADAARPSTRKGRSRNGSGRPGTSVRPTTGTRPGTSGSVHASNLPHYIRIYRADESYSILAFPVTATTADIINFLSGAGDTSSSRRITTNMRLYIRERGQDRQLHPSERPLMIQDRRLRQAGYTEAEKIEELGKDDLVLFCKFIYQVPHLPVMNPEEESSYDSFEFIDIGHRGLLTIPIFLHLHAHNIIILNISRNPMSDIPLDFVQACTNLKELRMSYMTLKRIPTSICASTTLSRLDVSCNRIADLESVPLHEIHTLLSLKVQNNKLTTIPSYFAQMKSLKYLNISNNKFEHFPDVLCEMSNLVDLDVSFNNIAELPSEMSNLKSLERLAAFGNELRTFPASFATLANLRALDVRRNKLTGLTSVYALPNLTTLQADYNNLVTLDAQLGAKVRQFSVPHNSITRFTLAPQLNMSGVSYALTHLNLSHGKISILADEALEGLVNLVDLNLNFNQFTRIPPIGTLQNLEILSVTDNLLESLPQGLGKLQKLRILNVHNNNLKGMSSEFWTCSSLEHLNASSNLMTALPNPPSLEVMAEVVGQQMAEEIFSDMTNGVPNFPIARSLRRLHLADNSFSDDILPWLALATELVVLNLSFNDIYEIPSGVLSKWAKLEQLYLSGNQITTLPSEDLEKLRNLKVLHLNGNKMQTLPSELGALTCLQHLDVGSNVLKYNIANWPYDWNWNWNTELRYLNLSGNKRLEIKPTSAQEMQHASGFRKDLSDFTALKKLRVLGLMDVTLRIPSVPDESDEKRVRTSFSDINNMRYGISDMIGSNEYLAMFDLVVPNFRGKENECLFGMFGRSSSQTPAGKIPRFLQQHFASSLSDQLDKLGEMEDVLTALRRTFLFSNREAFQYLREAAEANARKASIASFASSDSNPRSWSSSSSSQLNTGASGAVVYLVDKTLHVANVGDCLVILSRKGEAELLSKYFDPTDREETARIRRAEAWVSTKGYVNDEKDVDISRAVGFFQHFPAVNASPEIKTRPLSESDEFVIIGNHALWKCCSYQTAVDIARTERDDPMMAAQKLRDFAISYGAEGSVMVMVVNVSDLFYGRGPRSRLGGSGPVEPAADSARDKRNIRRRYEAFGDRTLNRLQQEIEPPQGQVAIVFTDIVNSTYLWETNPGMPTAIKIHHNLMRRQLRMDGGYEVKTEGDSFMVSFQTVTAALLWAFNCQIGLLQQEWPREVLQAEDGKVVYDSEGNLVQRGLRVRMGVHWGSPQCERDPITRRMDYYGPMVNRAARINASADGGQLMASQDVINEIQALREYTDTLDEAGLSEIPPEMKREIVELKRIDFEVKDMGERKLKGLEVPEKLHLLYPKSLAGRFETSNDLRANVEVADPRSLIAQRQIDIEEVRELAKVVLRLEHLCSAHQLAPQSPNPPSTATLGTAPPMMRTSSQQKEVSTPSKRHGHGRSRHHPPAYLGPHIKDDMNDEELLVIIESLTTRMENAMSTLYIKHLGGFGSVLAALEQATRIEPKLLVHAISLMHGAMDQQPT